MKIGDIVKIKWFGEWANCIIESLWSDGKRIHVKIPYLELVKNPFVKWDEGTRCSDECVMVKNPNRIKNDIIRNALFKRQAKLLEADK